ncbi:hypothetical protein LWE61_16280 [Sphingobium sufflavum]|uniref:hypothetical protein n=1 Tax=Sphingobium sufflavum TaxID=1129547 RepID=UPI001F491EF8|nr:hypothetical protein [Sphingobium sufflavum]MCE7798103.1 hypothetical protein [Sphingobium sufflavum]
MALALLLAVGAGAQVPTRPFSFMGDSTVRQTKRTSLAGEPCVNVGRALRCGPSKAITYDGQRLNFVSLEYWDGRMIRAVGAFDRGQHARVRALLVRAYGQPQHAGYQSMAERPDPFTHPETIWEFADGRLELDSRTYGSPVLLFRFSVKHPQDDEPRVGPPG